MPRKTKKGVEEIEEGVKDIDIDDEDEEREGEDDEDEEGGDDYLQDLPPGMLKKVVALKNLHESASALDAEYKRERVLLEAKYRDLKSPFLEKRFQIISGAIEVPADPDAPAEVSESAAEPVEEQKGIPGFWLQALANHPAIRDLVTEEDIPALEALADIKCEYNEDYTSFTLLFFFNENLFFSNQVLKKTYTVSPDLLDEKSPTLTGHESSEIDWLPGKNLCVAEIKKKQKAKSGKNKGQVRTIVKHEPKQSFFHYFGEPEDRDEEEEEEEEEEEKEHVKLSVEDDYDVGHSIRTAIIPEAILWFTGEAVEDDEDDIDYEGLEDADGEDEEDDDEDDDDEAPKLQKAPGGGFAAAPGAPGGAAPGGEQPECKQN